MITITIPLYAFLDTIPKTLLAAIFCIGAAIMFFTVGKLYNATIDDLGMNNPIHTGGLMLVIVGLVFLGAFIGDFVIVSMPPLPPIVFPIRFEVV
jgi:quinol-cytochrome oxidoreductase complex cytochrome b subunit